MSRFAPFVASVILHAALVTVPLALPVRVLAPLPLASRVELVVISPPPAPEPPTDPEPVAPRQAPVTPSSKGAKRSGPALPAQPWAPPTGGEGPAVAVVPAETATGGGPVALPGLPSIRGGVGPSTPPAPQAERRAKEPWRREIVARLQPLAGGRLGYRDTEFTAEIGRDGTVEFFDKHAFSDGVSTTIKVDVTDMLMRAAGDDPYRVAKERFLSATRVLRAQMARKWDDEMLENSVWDMKDRLRALWADGIRPASDRRADVFQLWDECAERGRPERLAASRAVRATIIGFVNDTLPQGSADAFSADELADLNDRRRSKASFRPYTRTATTTP